LRWRDPHLRVDRLRERALLVVEDALPLDAGLRAAVFAGFGGAVMVDLTGRVVHHHVASLLEFANLLLLSRHRR